MTWYYADGSRQVGPLTDAEFDNLVQSGVIRGDMLVWREGLPQWQPCSQVRGSQPTTTPATGGLVCRECGKIFPPDEVVQFGAVWVCGGCKPVFLQKLKEGATVDTVLNYAGFWIRFGAQFIDGIILGVVNFVISLLGMGVIFGSVMASGHKADGAASAVAMILAQLVIFAIQITIQMSYETFFIGKFGATPGKMACKLKVVQPDGSPITYGRAFGRFWGKQLSTLTLCIGYMMAGFDKEEHRALHDRICNTRVIKQ